MPYARSKGKLSDSRRHLCWAPSCKVHKRTCEKQCNDTKGFSVKLPERAHTCKQVAAPVLTGI